VKPGDPILLDDGLLQLRVESSRATTSSAAWSTAACSRQEGHEPAGFGLVSAALTEKDKKDIVFRP